MWQEEGCALIGRGKHGQVDRKGINPKKRSLLSQGNAEEQIISLGVLQDERLAISCLWKSLLKLLCSSFSAEGFS